MTTTMSIAEFVAKHAVTMQHIPLARRPEGNDDAWGNTAFHFQCVISHKAGTIVVTYSMGSGHATSRRIPGTGRAQIVPPVPKLDEVLDSLKSDALSAANCRDFAEWAGEMGMDTDSIKALRTYEACIKIDHDLRWLFGVEAYSELINCESL